MSITRKTRQLLTPAGVLRAAADLDSASPPAKDLPWTVDWVRNGSEFREALKLREDAYGRHLGRGESAFDKHDLAANAFILVARDKRHGGLLGTMRVAFGSDSQVEMLSFHPDRSLLQGIRLGEARRLALKASRYATLVKLSLWKCFWLSCQSHEVERLLIAARPPMNDDYRLLLFEDAIPGGAWFEPAGMGDPHELLVLPVENLEARYKAHSTELHRFMFVLHHPDIRVVQSASVNPLFGSDPRRLLMDSTLPTSRELGLAI